ncbi:MAG TPA: DNA-processing protein DprA [Solirubrobacteraceae bacterium]|nr:DNA-processing protein DprA [Solirubrobacteraceae bacterium]
MNGWACDACLRRTWLIGRLAGAIELARHEKRVLRELLALSDEALVDALGDRAGAGVEAERERLDPARLRDACAAAALDAVCRHDDAYPARLRDLADPPAVLFVAAAREGVARLGRLAGGDLDGGAAAVSIVGTRRASADGNEIARGLGRGLSAAGICVVSGMALGVDSAAHAGALDGATPTVAVLAGGADVAYPASKRGLYARIVERGCVVSEMPPGLTPFKWCFPARNRTIAALGQMTVVVEAAERSGSLITAEVAADLGRDIGAVPGPVTSWRSKGTNALLRDGATLIRDARDVLDGVVGVESPTPADPAAGLEPRLASLLRAVAGGRDTLAALAGAPDQAQATLAALTELELAGRLRRVPGGRYVVVSRW